MTNRVHANNFVTTLNGDISSGATSIVISSATGFPTVGSGAVANVTLANGSTIEIVTCTARSGTTLTVTRGAEGTTPAAFLSGSTVSIRPTADSVDRKEDRDSYTTTATAAGTTTLTVNSTRDQFFTGSTTQTVVMPVVSTLSLGRKFHIVNESSGVVTVQSSGANSIQAMAANTILDLECIAITGTGTASWYANYRLKDNSTGGGGSGDFVGPGSSTDNAVVRFDGTTGKLGQNSGVIIDDSNNVTGVVALTATGHATIGGNSTAAGYVELLEDSDNGSNKITITAPASIASDKTATLPDASGTFTLLGNSSTGSGNVVLATNPTLSVSSATVARDDKILIQDTSASDITKYVTAQSLSDLNGDVGFRAYKSGSPQTLSSATFTKCALESEDYDNGGYFDSATNYRFTPLVAGTYLFLASITYTSLLSGTLVIHALFKNGVEAAEISNDYMSVAGSKIAVGGALLQMNGSTDYVELFGYVGDNNSNTVTMFDGSFYTYLSAVRVGP